MLKQVLVWTALVTTAMVIPTKAQQSPPASEQTKQIEALVNNAAAQIDSNGFDRLADRADRGDHQSIAGPQRRLAKFLRQQIRKLGAPPGKEIA